MSHLVTGDAVILGLQPAKLPSRALAIALDLLVVMGCYLVLSVLLTSTVLSFGTAAEAAVQVALVLLVVISGPIAVETLSHGRSLGKLACGLRVVRVDGGPIRFRHAMVRGLVGFVEILLSVGFIACVSSLVSERGRRLGDVFAGTIVVRERIPTGRSVPLPPPPPWLAGRFAQLDLSRVPDGLWLAVRQYLNRIQQLDPQVSWTMAVKLASDMIDYTGTPAPQGLDPAAYLTGVAAERQRRDAERTFGPPQVMDTPYGPFQAPGPPYGAAQRYGAQPPVAGPGYEPPRYGSEPHYGAERPAVGGPRQADRGPADEPQPACPPEDAAPPRGGGFAPPA